MLDAMGPVFAYGPLQTESEVESCDLQSGNITSSRRHRQCCASPTSLHFQNIYTYAISLWPRQVMEYDMQDSLWNGHYDAYPYVSSRVTPYGCTPSSRDRYTDPDLWIYHPTNLHFPAIQLYSVSKYHNLSFVLHYLSFLQRHLVFRSTHIT